jgi:hypothetical protein
MRHGMKVILLSAFCAAGVCSAASGQTTLRYKFVEGEKLQYVIEQKITMTKSIMNMEIEEKMNVSMDLTWNVISVNRDGSARVQFKVTNAKMSRTSAAGTVEVDSAQKNEPDEQGGKALSQLVKAWAAVNMTGTMLATGEIKDLQVSEPSTNAMKGVPPETFKSLVSELFLTFSADAVTKSKSWTNKLEAKTPIFKVSAENTCTYEGTVQKEGVMLEKISVKPDLRIEPAPKSPIKEVKEAKGSGQFLFDNKRGRIIDAVVDLNVPLLFADFNQKTDKTTTIRLKK